MSQDGTLPTSFYRRPLPPSQVAFSSSEGRAIFREALAEGHLEGYFALAEQFHTQAEPAYCGLGSLVVALNALAIDPGRLWKGPWRWFGEELLDCCIPLEEVRRRGLTLDEIGCLAECNGARVTVRRPDDGGLDAFRETLATCARAAGRVVVASYSRAALGQTGDGHFSPIAGLHRGRDLALLLDVARFKYPPHWVPVGELWEAMRPPDPDTGRSRGYLTLERSDKARSIVFHLRPKRPWGEVLAQFEGGLASSAAVQHGDVGLVLLGAVASLGDALEIADAIPPETEPRQHAEALFEALRATPLFAAVRAAGDGALAASAIPEGPRAHEHATLLILILATGDALGVLPSEARLRAEALVSAPLRAPLDTEVAAMRAQIALLRASVRRASCH